MQRAWIVYRDARCAAEASALDATPRQALILDNELPDLK
jgi:uncharacterized protein YecT (DUF1311 family)